MAPNLLEDDAEVLVNTTNAFGVMGAGLALAFARRWPEILPPYQADCRKGVLHGGACVLYDLPSDIFNASPRKWAAFCTKHHWRDKSNYAFIEKGLTALKGEMKKYNLTSVAIPPLGCGLGGLDWAIVERMIAKAFSDTNIEVHIYTPQKTCYVFGRPNKTPIYP